MANVIILLLLTALMFLQLIQRGEGRELKIPHRTNNTLVISHTQILTKEIKDVAAPYSPKISDGSKKRNPRNEFSAKNLQLGQQKETLVQALPAQNQVTESFQTSSAPPPPGHDIDSFRPTAPGHSPGVGHSLGN